MAFPLSEIFPDEDYRFHLTLRKGEPAGFFGSLNPVVMAERRRWFGEDPARYAAGTEEAASMLSDFENFVRDTLGRPLASSTASDEVPGRLVLLGCTLEPDFVLLLHDGAGVFRACGGAVCFPSSWALAEKLGRTLDEIHGIVPGLNPNLGSKISQVLQKLKPGTGFERSNWGLVATPSLNMHPDLACPRLSLPLNPEQVWVRIEDQILTRLSATDGIVFGIRIRVLPLRAIIGQAGLRAGFYRGLRTMPEALAAYKGIAPIRDALVKAMDDKF